MILEQRTSQLLFQPNTTMQWQHRWLYMKMLQRESYRKEWLALYRKCQPKINNNEKYIIPSTHKVPSIKINCNFTASILSQGSTLCMILSTVNKLYLLMLKYLLILTEWRLDLLSIWMDERKQWTYLCQAIHWKAGFLHILVRNNLL